MNNKQLITYGTHKLIFQQSIIKKCGQNSQEIPLVVKLNVLFFLIFFPWAKMKLSDNKSYENFAYFLDLQHIPFFCERR